MFKSKWLNVFMVLALILLAACSGNKGSQNNDAAASGSPSSAAPSGSASPSAAQSAEPEKITVHVGINWIPPVKNDGVADQLRAEASGVYTKWTYETSDNEDTGRRLKLTSGDLPDVWAFYGPNGPAQADFLNAKVVEPIEQYLNMPEKYPNLAKIPDVIKDYVKAPDGHTYFIPLFIDIPELKTPASEAAKDGFWSWGQNGIFVRTDILEKTGMKKEDLATIDGFEKFLAEAGKQKDASGKPLIPLTMKDNFAGWRAIGAMFGVDNVNDSWGFFPDNAGGFMATRDAPRYKDAWAWINKIYTAGLLDKESPTQKKDLFEQKLTTGRVAAYVGQMSDITEKGWKAAKDLNDVSTKFEAIEFPKVPGVDKIGGVDTKNPLPWTGAYIMKGKNMEAGLKYLDWCLGNDIMTVKYGPAGPGPKFLWNWTDDSKTVWHINPEYVADLAAGDPNKEQKYGAQPWFLANTNTPDIDTSETNRKQLHYDLMKKSGSLLAKTGVMRPGHNYDLVPTKPGGVMEKYKPALDAVELEYRAKLMTAKTPAAFEEIWNQYRKDIENKGKWNEYKAEWKAQFDEFSKKVKF
jgi:putative aldouronate transport system substrate-binding protein